VYLASPQSYQAIDLQAGATGVTTLLTSSSAPTTAAVNLGTNSFRFYGANYTGATSLYVSKNGLITFGSANTSATNTNLLSAPSQPAIAPFWDDLKMTAGNSGAVLSKLEDTNGDSTPDRLIIEWSNVETTTGSTSPATSCCRP